jgi:hypothetical protein
MDVQCALCVCVCVCVCGIVDGTSVSWLVVGVCAQAPQGPIVLPSSSVASVERPSPVVAPVAAPVVGGTLAGPVALKAPVVLGGAGPQALASVNLGRVGGLMALRAPPPAPAMREPLLHGRGDGTEASVGPGLSPGRSRSCIGGDVLRGAQCAVFVPACGLGTWCSRV